MNFVEFRQKYEGKRWDYDKRYGDQCVDLMRFYSDELGLPQFPLVLGAGDLWTSYPQEGYTRIKNTPDGVPLAGDIVIWQRAPSTPVGHVALFIAGDTRSFTSLDQNWGHVPGTPEGGPATVQRHTYTGVIGWFRPDAPAPVDFAQEDALLGIMVRRLPKGWELEHVDSHSEEWSVINIDSGEFVSTEDTPEDAMRAALGTLDND